MTDHRYDGSSIDLERALVRYMAERRISRRTLLTRIGTAGALVTLGPVVAACASTGSPSPAASLGAEPEPEAELFVYNWADYMGEDVVSSFEDKYGVKVTYDFFDNYDTMFARIGQSGGGYDVSFPASTDIPALLEQGLVQALDLSLIPNVANLGAEWADPAYDPGNKHSVPYMWWTTGVAYDTEQISDELTSWSALWDERWAGHISMLDDMREVFASALLQQGKDINTTDEGELDAALTLLKKQKPIVRTYTTVSRQGGSLKLLNLTKRITDLLSITKLLTVFETYDSETDAVQSFSASAQV